LGIEGQALWVARLSNGHEVTQDDGRPGVSPHSAWERLAAHIKQERLSIEKLWLVFRSNVRRDILPEQSEGYFFCKAALGNITWKHTQQFYLLGSLKGNEVSLQRWSVPDLTL